MKSSSMKRSAISDAEKQAEAELTTFGAVPRSFPELCALVILSDADGCQSRPLQPRSWEPPCRPENGLSSGCREDRSERLRYDDRVHAQEAPAAHALMAR
eukprot:CAMPEP_0197942302 /NCGR_PEP_ID=MMETSP1439-20131203/124145_1 /TAXON_ID=66791 /ORGANISM="Gonyaulax spinifera, Strain CCMP409" /LENGTH=99 /DNA_ID=CAMNT_0043565549 /DNA_START=54 /DNA_END=350 /DNA_ORIENTATION=-